MHFVCVWYNFLVVSHKKTQAQKCRSGRGGQGKYLYRLIALPTPALPGLSLWKFDLRELVAPSNCDLCTMRTTTGCTAYGGVGMVHVMQCTVYTKQCVQQYRCSGG